MQNTYVVLSLVIIAGAYLYLIRGILFKGIKLNFTSQLIWAVLDIVVALSLVSAKGAFWQPTFYAVGCLVLACCIYRTGYAKWGKSDTFISLLAIASIFIFVYADPRTATIASTIAVIVAGIPQMIDCWKRPQDTPVILFLAFLAAHVLSILAGTEWSIEQRFFPVACLIYCLVCLTPAVVDFLCVLFGWGDDEEDEQSEYGA